MVNYQYLLLFSLFLFSIAIASADPSVSITDIDSVDAELRVIASVKSSGGDYIDGNMIIYQDGEDTIILNNAINVEDEFEPGVSVSRDSETEGPLKGNNLEFSCGTCSSADFSDAVTSIGGGSDVICGYTDKVPKQIAQNDDQLCARSTVTGIKYDIDILSWAARTNCWDSDGGQSCNDSNNKISYTRTTADQLITAGYDNDDEYDISNIGLVSGDEYELHVYVQDGNDLDYDRENFDYGGESILVMQAPDKGNKLRFKDIDIKVGTETDKDLQLESDGYKISKEAELGDKLRFDVEIENLFQSKTITDVFMKITIDDIEFGDDLEDETTEKEIDGGQDGSFDLEFELAERIDEDEYTVSIEVEGIDEDGEKHEVSKEFLLKVDLENKDLKLEQKKISPTRVSSCDGIAEIILQIINYGSSELDEVRVVVKNEDMGLDYDQKDIYLDTGSEDDAVLQLSIPVNATGVEEGSYDIDIELYESERKKTLDAKLSLDVLKCREDDDEDAPPPPIQGQLIADNFDELIDQQDDEDNVVDDNETVAGSDDSSSDNKTILLLVAATLLLIVIVLGLSLIALTKE